MERMSIDDFRELTRAKKLGLPEPKKKRRKQRDLQAQYADSKTPRCPATCAEGSRLYRELGVILRLLHEHRETHQKETT